jgi:tetratricopeptide (TPR) repeat protein
MTVSALRLAKGLAAFAGVLAMTVSAASFAAEPVPFSKDVGPASAACDGHAKGSAAWTACVGRATAAMPDQELFYAGYWLAKNGQYREALGYLNLAKVKDERVLTYIGFATRKLGDVEAALPLYASALKLNPNYSVARAYLGEAFLTKGEPAKAKAELAEIAQRCGTTCAEYADLSGHIARYEAGAARKG